MTESFVLLAMIFCHIVDDYGLQQQCLSKLKQKTFWQENAPDKLYKHDYIVALLVHGFSWSFMVMLPVALYHGFQTGFAFELILIVNAVAHAVIDHLKANKHLINLATDQMAHLVQITAAFGICVHYGLV